jgi:hypothetical protein
MRTETLLDVSPALFDRGGRSRCVVRRNRHCRSRYLQNHHYARISESRGLRAVSPTRGMTSDRLLADCVCLGTEVLNLLMKITGSGGPKWRTPWNSDEWECQEKLDLLKKSPEDLDSAHEETIDIIAIQACLSRRDEPAFCRFRNAKRDRIANCNFSRRVLINVHSTRAIQQTVNYRRFHPLRVTCGVSRARSSRKSQQRHWPDPPPDRNSDLEVMSATFCIA